MVLYSHTTKGTNMAECVCATERCNSAQEKDSDWPRLNKKLAPKRGAASVTWCFGFKKSDMDTKIVFGNPAPTESNSLLTSFSTSVKNHVKQNKEGPWIRVYKPNSLNKPQSRGQWLQSRSRMRSCTLKESGVFKHLTCDSQRYFTVLACGEKKYINLL